MLLPGFLPQTGCDYLGTQFWWEKSLYDTRMNIFHYLPTVPRGIHILVPSSFCETEGVSGDLKCPQDIFLSMKITSLYIYHT